MACHDDDIPWPNIWEAILLSGILRLPAIIDLVTHIGPIPFRNSVVRSFI